MCGSKGGPVVVEILDRVHGVPGTFRYRACDACGSAFQDPRVVDPDVPLCYPNDYYTHEDESDEARGRAARSGGEDTERTVFGLAACELRPKAGSRPRAIDVGCGAGATVAALRALGWDAEGLDRDPVAADLARRRSGAVVHAADFRTAELDEGSYRLVVMRDALEHFPDPPAVLARAASLLAPGGLMLVRGPNPRSLGARVYGGAWVGWEAPRHLVLPSERALLAAAGPLGLVCVRRATSAELAAYFSAVSRLIARGRPVRRDSIAVTAADRTLAALERALICLGARAGEEIVVTFARAV